MALFLMGSWSADAQAEEAQTAVVLTIKGAIGPAVSDYVMRGIRKAEEDKAALVILQMDTPGGLDHAMRDIIKTILSASVPVISYVAPDGSRAASAGTYILYASHVAAMAPSTNLGAATPVKVGGLPGLDEKPHSPQKKEDKAPSSAMERKMVNDAVAYIKALAHRYGRNAEWAEKAVRESVSLTAQEALKSGVIDLVAEDLNDLLRKLDGRKVSVAAGTISISSKNMIISRADPDWRSNLLTIISDPNIAYFLLLFGFYGLIYELAHPGHVLPGVAGAISLLLALYTFQLLPINYAGLALIVLGIVFMISEAFVPSFGSLGIGGIIAFVAGSIILVDEKSMRISLSLIGATALTSAAFFFWMMTRLLTISRKKVLTGAESMIGGIGEAMEDFDHQGRIWINGESWRAVTRDCVQKGQKVRITEKDGLQLKIEILQEEQ